MAPTEAVGLWFDLVRFGLSIFPTAESIQPAELAALAEDREFESLWFPEHTHIPTSRTTPYPAGGDLPDEYKRIYDPFIALTAAAVVTERLLVGTGICLIVEQGLSGGSDHAPTTENPIDRAACAWRRSNVRNVSAGPPAR